MALFAEILKTKPAGPGRFPSQTCPQIEKSYHKRSTPRGVAQLGRALRSGRRGRVFKSLHPDFKTKNARLSFRMACVFFVRGENGQPGALLVSRSRSSIREERFLRLLCSSDHDGSRKLPQICHEIGTEPKALFCSQHRIGLIHIIQADGASPSISESISETHSWQ